MIHRLSIALLVGVTLLLAGAVPGASAGPVFTTLATTRLAGSPYTPDQIRTAYDFSPLYDRGIDGTGQTVALLEIDKLDTTGLQQFDQEYSLPDITVQENYVGGTPFKMTVDGEATMDVEWLHALAPGAAIQVYYVNARQSEAAGWRDMATAIRTAAANGASIMSVSLGACNPAASYQQAKSAFADVSAAGATVFVASGDYGDRAGSKRACGSKIDVVYPGADPSVVAVGGTSLYLNLDDTIAREVAWKDSGGGRVKWMARPLWQKAAMLPKDSNRWAPDVAFLGNMNTGVSAVFNGDWQQAGGTSLGAPAWAAAWALIRQSVTSSGKTIGTAAPLLYKVGNSAKYTQVFHDVTSGTNGHYKAAIGWDPVTGWGTPDVSALADAMQKYAKTPTVTTTPPQTGGL